MPVIEGDISVLQVFGLGGESYAAHDAVLVVVSGRRGEDTAAESYVLHERLIEAQF